MIIEGLGCYPAFYPSWLTITFIAAPQYAFAAVPFVFSGEYQRSSDCQRLELYFSRFQALLFETSSATESLLNCATQKDFSRQLA